MKSAGIDVSFEVLRTRIVRPEQAERLPTIREPLPDSDEITLIEAWDWVAFGTVIADETLERDGRAWRDRAEALQSEMAVEAGRAFSKLPTRPTRALVKALFPYRRSLGTAGRQLLLESIAQARLERGLAKRRDQAAKWLLNAGKSGRVRYRGKRQKTAPLECLDSAYFRAPVRIEPVEGGFNLDLETDSNDWWEYARAPENERLKRIGVLVSVEDLKREASKKQAAEPHVHERPKRKRGRKPQYDWDGAERHLFGLLNRHGPPNPQAPDWRDQAAMERAIADWFSDRNPNHVPSESRVRDMTVDIYSRWEESKADYSRGR